MIWPPRTDNECGTCGHPTFRPEGHAEWCWTAHPDQPDLGAARVPYAPIARPGSLERRLETGQPAKVAR